MTRTIYSIKKNLTLFALFATTLVTFGIPGFYFFSSYNYLSGTIDSEIELGANLIGTLTSENPELWVYEELRIKKLLVEHSKSTTPVMRNITDVNGKIVADNNIKLNKPFLKKEHHLFESGREVGHIEIAHSLTPVIKMTFMLFILCGACSFVVFHRLRTIPLAIIEKTYHELNDSETKYHSVYESIKEGLFLCQVICLGGKCDVVFFEANTTFFDMFDLTANDITKEQNIINLIGGIFRPYVNEIVDTIHCKKTNFFQVNYNNKIIEVSVFYVNEKMVSLLCDDITEQINSKNKIEKLAYTDALTDVPNRVILIDRLEQAIVFSERQNIKVAVLFIDLDRFKLINDTMGHSVGDLVLIEVAKRLHACIRKSDTLARVGGDEFVIISASNDISGISVFAQALLDVLSHACLINGIEIFTGASIGISVYPADGKNAEELIKHADIAMYTAKVSSKNRFAYYSTEMNIKLNERMITESSLRRAIEQNEFMLEYQPVIDAKTMKIVSVEALIRWNDPIRGRVMPDYFIDVAEDSGLIRQIGEWVIRTVCLNIKNWEDRGIKPVRVAVNVSGKQFLNGKIDETISDILNEVNIDASLLEVELTETSLIKDIETTIETLAKLKKINVAIAIDDFGIGYSSLGYLKHFPIDYLKIDRSFVRDACNSQDGKAIVEAIIAVAKAMRLRVVAEGVENEEQMLFLQSKQCDEFQGYLFYKPLSEDDFIKELIRQNTEDGNT